MYWENTCIYHKEKHVIKEAGLEVYAKNIKYIFVSHEQNARKNRSLR